MNLWLNPSTGVLASCQQEHPLLSNGQIVRGIRSGNQFAVNPNGPDIQHAVTAGQVELPEDHPLIRERRGLGPAPIGRT